MKNNNVIADSNFSNNNPVKERTMPENNPNLTPKAEEQEYILRSDFQNMFMVKTPEQYEVLKLAIRNDGILNSFVVWEEKNILLDGHTRHQICVELEAEGNKIEKPPIQKMSFENDKQAKMWMIVNQLSRRKASSYQRILAALQYQELYAQRGKANQRTAGKKALSQNFVKVDTDKNLAQLAGTNHETLRQARKIRDKATPDEIAKLCNDKISIHSIYKKYAAEERIAKSIPKSNKKSNGGTMPNNETAKQEEDSATDDVIDVDWECEQQRNLEACSDADATAPNVSLLSYEGENTKRNKTIGEIMNEALDSLDEFLKSSTQEDRIKELESIDKWKLRLQNHYNAITNELEQSRKQNEIHETTQTTDQATKAKTA